MITACPLIQMIPVNSSQNVSVYRELQDVKIICLPNVYKYGMNALVYIYICWIEGKMTTWAIFITWKVLLAHCFHTCPIIVLKNHSILCVSSVLWISLCSLYFYPTMKVSLLHKNHPVLNNLLNPETGTQTSASNHRGRN